MMQAIKSTGTNPDYTSLEYWLEKLGAACRQAQVESAALGIIHKDEMISVSYGKPLLLDGTPEKQNPAFCIAKLFTSTLVSVLVLQGKLKFEDEVRGLLPMSAAPASTNVLAGITIANLLSHTHGLDSINLDAAPVGTDGFIDHEVILNLLQHSSRIFAPGRFYSYGVEGYMLLGLVIEHLTQKTYREVLYDEILAHIADGPASQPGATGGILPTLAICPSSGRGLSVPLVTLLAFVNCFLNPESNALHLTGTLIAEIFRKTIAMPGWSPMLSGCCYGWKAYGAHWHGQNGMDGQNLMYVRVNRATDTAICLVAQSRQRNPGALPSLLLQDTYPELGIKLIKQPGILTDVTTDSCKAMAGTYGNCLCKFEIRYSDERLLLEVRSGKYGSSHHCYLYPAENNIFFLSKPWQFVTFLQLVKDDCSARYLWDHTQLWPEWTN